MSLTTRYRTLLLTSAVVGAVITIGTLYPQQTVYALSLSRTLYNFTGDTAVGRITLEDVAGGVKLSTEITAPTVNGDIAGIWFGLKDINLLNTLLNNSITNLTTNTGESTYQLFTDSRSCPASGYNNLKGGGSPCDSGLLNGLLTLGKAGSSAGWVQSASFVISAVQVSDFNDAFGLRYQSTGGTEGSSKLGYYYPGYMGTTSSVFYLEEGQTVPQGAISAEDSGGRGGGAKTKGK